MPTALVTGSTAGIGAAFADRLAADGHDLVLVARDADRLREQALTLKEAHGVQIETIIADLSRPDERTQVSDRLARAGVDLLVNNAGMGNAWPFWKLHPDAAHAQFELHAGTVFELTTAALPGMLDRRRGAVLNVSSLAGVLPGPNGVAYTAEKTFVVQLTLGLAAALQGTGVRAIAVCPGFTRTELHKRAGVVVGDRSSGWWLNPEDVVDRALVDLRRGRALSVPGWRNRCLLRATDVLPHGLVRYVSSRLARRSG
jgi:hypothetical protein